MESVNIDLLIERTQPNTVVDVGAFHGDFTREIVDKCPNVRITMMEANPNCEEHLKKVGKKYHIAALSNQKKEGIPFYIRKGYSTCTGASLYKENTEAYVDADVMRVNTHRLDEYKLYKEGIDLLKIDVQGSELDVLKGGVQTLKRTKSILLECSLTEYNEGGAKIDEIINYLKGKGFYPNEIIGTHWLEHDKKIKGKSIDGRMNQLDVLFTDTLNENVIHRIAEIQQQEYQQLRAYVISLTRREDRRRLFDVNNGGKIRYEFVDAVDGNDLTHDVIKEWGYDTDKTWRDPEYGNRLTKGMVGCYISHHRLWEKCIELNEPIFIFEDDARILDNFNLNELIEMSHKYELVYAGYAEKREKDTIKKGKWQIPIHPYWASSYIITPEGARKLINKNKIVPTDEHLININLNAIGTIDAMVDQGEYSRNPDKKPVTSDVEPYTVYRTFLDFKVHALTFGTDESRMNMLYNSAKHHNIEFTNIGKGLEWRGSSKTDNTGCGQKINVMREYIQNLPDYDVVLFVDGYDVFMADCLNQIMYRYIIYESDYRLDFDNQKRNAKVIFAAEQYCWPDATLCELYPDDVYLNGGCWIGQVKEMKRILAPIQIPTNPPRMSVVKDDDDEQLYYTKKYLSGKYSIALDKDCTIFQCNDNNVIVKEGNYGKELLNQTTYYQPCVYHGNGNADAKNKMNQLYNSLYSH